jgi:hypothetical protein
MSDYDAPYQAVLEYLDSKNFKHTPYPEEHRVTLSMSGKNASFRFTARISHEGDYLQVAVNLPFYVRDDKQRLSVAELITRANYCMPLGKFEMDMKDGEVRFHIAHVIGELGLTSAMIEKHFMTAYYTADRYFPAFMQHLHAGYTPEDAVFHAELDTHAEMVEETPKPAPKGKRSPSSPSPSAPAPSDANARPSTFDARPDSPSGPTPKPPRKPARKKNGGEASGQGELPI